MDPERDPRPPFWRRPSWWLAQFAFLALGAYLLGDLARCLGECHADVELQQGHPRNVADIQLNAWALAWVQHALTTDPGSLWDGPIFHPNPGMLTGSEHMLGLSLPLLLAKPFAPSALWLHQCATLLSFLILGWCGFGLVGWLTRSDWAAFVAATCAAYAPWRMNEFGHVQILGMHWYPLIWLLTIRILLGPSRAWFPPLLAGILFLQLATSYYLAYQISASLAILLLSTIWIGAPDRRRIATLGAALLFAYAAFAAVSLPYLEFQDAGQLVDRGVDRSADRIVTREEIEENLAKLRTSAEQDKKNNAETIAWIVCAVSIAALLYAAAFRRSEKSERSPGREAYVTGAVAWSVLALLLAGGNSEYRLGSFWFWTPGRLLLEIAPGYEHIRGHGRWLYLSAVTIAMLAGVGVDRIDRWIKGRNVAGWRPARWGARALTLISMLALLPLQPIPVRRVDWPADPAIYRAIGVLPEGPVLEVPWSRFDAERWLLESSYMLAGTLHWKPLLNGYTRFWPPGVPLLQEIAQDLPQPSAVDLLVRLTGLRWVVVHSERFGRDEGMRWERAETDSTLRRVGGDDETWIFELPAGTGRGALESALLSEPDPHRSVTGISRAPIDPAPNDASWSAELPRRIVSMQAAPVRVRIENRSARDWPGVDVDAEGLLRLRYRYVDWKRQTVLEGLAPIRSDIAAGSTWQRELELPAPGQPRRYHLTLDLVQIVDGEATPIGLPEQSRWVIVKPFGGFGVREQPKPESGPGPDAAGLDSRADPAAAASGPAHGDENR